MKVPHVMSDMIFVAFLMLAIGVGFCQALTAWELLLMHRLTQEAALQRETILADHREFRDRQARMLESLRRLEARPSP